MNIWAYMSRDNKSERVRPSMQVGRASSCHFWLYPVLYVIRPALSLFAARCVSTERANGEPWILFRRVLQHRVSVVFLCIYNWMNSWPLFQLLHETLNNLLALIKLLWQLVTISMQQWTSQTQWVENIATTLYLVFPAGAHSKPNMFFFLPLCEFVNISLCHFLTFAPFFSTKDNIDMLLCCQYRELTHWITGHNELSLPL